MCFAVNKKKDVEKSYKHGDIDTVPLKTAKMYIQN